VCSRENYDLIIIMIKILLVSGRHSMISEHSTKIGKRGFMSSATTCSSSFNRPNANFLTKNNQKPKPRLWAAVWFSGSALVSINGVTLYVGPGPPG